jgi:hypothetical protein
MLIRLDVVSGRVGGGAVLVYKDVAVCVSLQTQALGFIPITFTQWCDHHVPIDGRCCPCRRSKGHLRITWWIIGRQLIKNRNDLGEKTWPAVCFVSVDFHSSMIDLPSIGTDSNRVWSSTLCPECSARSRAQCATLCIALCREQRLRSRTVDGFRCNFLVYSNKSRSVAYKSCL